MQSKKRAYYGLFAALAIMMGYVELLIPLPIGIPGVKLGLANIIIVILLYFMDARAAVFVSVVRVILSGLMFAGFAGLLYSLSGAILSLIAMIGMHKIDKFSVIGVSIGGGIFHNVGQILVAALVVENAKLFYYLPILMISGIVTGAIIGIVAQLALVYLKRNIS